MSILLTILFGLIAIAVAPAIFVGIKYLMDYE